MQKELFWLDSQTELIQGQPFSLNWNLFQPEPGYGPSSLNTKFAMIKGFKLALQIRTLTQCYRAIQFPRPTSRVVIFVDQRPQEPYPVNARDLFTEDSKMGFLRKEFQSRFQILHDEICILSKGKPIPTSVDDESNQTRKHSSRDMQFQLPSKEIVFEGQLNIDQEEPKGFKGGFNKSVQYFSGTQLDETRLNSNILSDQPWIIQSADSPLRQRYIEPQMSFGGSGQKWTTWSADSEYIQIESNQQILWERVKNSSTGECQSNSLQLLVMPDFDLEWQYNAPGAFILQNALKANVRVWYEQVK